jgi:hypothetical protein
MDSRPLAHRRAMRPVLRKLHKKAEARRVEARVRELQAKADKENPGRFEVDWRDLQESKKR